MNNVKAMLESVEKIFQSVESSLTAMTEGQRVQMKELAHTVAMSVGMQEKDVQPFVNHYVHNADGVYVTRGKYGGIIKGNKPAKKEG